MCSWITKEGFLYEYKYGRNSGEIQEYVKVVPFSKENIPQETLERLQISIPETFELIRGFNQTNKKTDFISNDERI
jgi:glutamate racemase